MAWNFTKQHRARSTEHASDRIKQIVKDMQIISKENNKIHAEIFL